MRRWLVVGAVFLIGFGTSQLISFFKTPRIRPSEKPVEITKEATATGVLGKEKREEAMVARVIDGDTVELVNGRRVRYIGIDTPEVVDPRKPVECFAREAKEENQKLVEGKSIRLEKDVSETDKYGRLLRYVYVGEVMVNEYLVRQGFALSSTYPPDVKHQERLLAAQQEARQQKRGLWGGCPAEQDLAPRDNPTNTTNPTNPTNEEPSDSCVIKGNISAKGEKIYHLPGCGSYDKTVVDEGVGERWFCSEAEAVAAGWRRAKNCP